MHTTDDGCFSLEPFALTVFTVRGEQTSPCSTLLVPPLHCQRRLSRSTSNSYHHTPHPLLPQTLDPINRTLQRMVSTMHRALSEHVFQTVPQPAWMLQLLCTGRMGTFFDTARAGTSTTYGTTPPGKCSDFGVTNSWVANALRMLILSHDRPFASVASLGTISPLQSSHIIDHTSIPPKTLLPPHTSHTSPTDP